MAQAHRITEDFIQKWSLLNKEVGEMEEKIIERIQEILYLVCDLYEAERPDYIYFPDAPEGDVGTLSSAWGYETINIVARYNKRDKYGNDYADHPDIYTRYLTMSDEEIKEEILTEIKKAKEKKQKQQQARAKRKANKQKLIQEARAKLSKQELKALTQKN